MSLALTADEIALIIHYIQNLEPLELIKRKYLVHDEIYHLAPRKCNASIHCQSDIQGQIYSSFPAHFIMRQANQNVEIFALKSDTFDIWHLFSSPSTTWHPFAFLSSTLPICQLWPRRIKELFFAFVGYSWKQQPLASTISPSLSPGVRGGQKMWPIWNGSLIIGFPQD